MARRILELREEETERFPGSMLSDAEVLALKDSGKFEVDPASVFNKYSHGVRSPGWVGQIPIGDELLVRVIPKVPVSNLFRMLEVAYNLKSFRLFPGDVQIESIEDIYERIVSILSRRVVDRARKGLYRGYIAETDALPYVRGTIDVLGTVLNSLRGIPQIPCHYEEHTADLEDNKILYWTLHQARRQAIRREKIRSELDRARRALAGTITLQRFSPSDCVDRFYHRLNYDYQPMHGLCRFILEQTGPGIQSGDRTFIPFAVDMRQLFQSFVAEWLRTNAPPGTTVRIQHTAQLHANVKIEIRIDILLCEEGSQKPIAVIDTKYKASELPTEDDRNQIAFYAGELQVDHGMFVYPSTIAKHFYLVHANKMTIESLVFDVGQPLDAAGSALLISLKGALDRRRSKGSQQ
jgi:5-methylcytosine-specific restriction enzyme subunit McrC